MELMNKPIVFKGIDAYCPVCEREMYAGSVADIMENGGECPWCSSHIRRGESIYWSTLDGTTKLSCDLTTQHISNILHMFESRGTFHSDTQSILKAELKFRGEVQLPFEPHYSADIEQQIRHVT